MKEFLTYTWPALLAGGLVLLWGAAQIYADYSFCKKHFSEESAFTCTMSRDRFLMKKEYK